MSHNAISTTEVNKKTEDFSFLANKKVVYLVNVDWFFISHRLPLARAARDAGADVIVAAGDTGKGATLEKEGIHFVPLPFSRQGTSVLHELRTIFSVYRFLRKTKPDLLHTVSIKPVLYGALLSRIAGTWPVVNAISGLGYVFSREKKANILRRVISLFYKAALGNPGSITIFQNPSDMDIMLSSGLIKKKQTALIRGSGVDCSKFTPSPFPENPVVMLPARMLWDKGVGEFVKAAHILHPKFPSSRFVLVGPSDDENPNAISRKTLVEWTTKHPYIEWWGPKEAADMHSIIPQATIIALPTYYPEGLPKCLLEGAACGRPLVASNIPACREIVREGVNGLLVPYKDSAALSAAIDKILQSSDLQKNFGDNGRNIACKEFAEDIIVYQIFELYKKLMHHESVKGEN